MNQAWSDRNTRRDPLPRPAGSGEGVPGGGVLYHGIVMHRRLRPFVHRFHYRVAYLHLDIDRLTDLDRRLRLFSYNRGNLFSFHDRDHGPRDGTPLRPWVEGIAAERGIDIRGGRIELLCFPRMLGYAFNPLAIYFCHRSDGSLAAMLYAVSNTFGEHHNYFIPVSGDAASGDAIQQAVDKRFYVSPFIGMTSRYRFRIRPPDERLSVLIRQSVPEGPQLVATLTGTRATLTDRALASITVRYPMLTYKVMAAIHWEALWLWGKGAKFHTRPEPPSQSVTDVPDQQTAASDATR